MPWSREEIAAIAARVKAAAAVIAVLVYLRTRSAVMVIVAGMLALMGVATLKLR